MSMEISYPNTGLISPNYDVINKANKILAGKTAEDLKANTSGTMQELSTEEVTSILIGGADGPTSVFIAGKVGNGFGLGTIFVGIILVVAGVAIFIKSKKK